MNQIAKILSPIKRKIQLMIGRAIVAAIDDSGNTQKLQLKLLADEVATGVERVEEYGFSTYPLTDSEALTVFRNGNRSQGIVLCVHDRRYRPSYLSSGEVVMYTSEDSTLGHRIHFKQGGEIEIQCVDKNETITGSVSKQITTNEEKTIGGDATKTVSGSDTETITGSKTITASSVNIVPTTLVNLGASSGTRFLVDERLIALFNSHTHSGVTSGAGVTGSPVVPLVSGSTCTTMAKAL